MTTTREHGAARTVVAVFTDRSEARDAARELHDAGYKDTWIGTTRPHGPTDDARGVEPGTITGTIDGTDVVEGGTGDVLGKIGRFFAGTDYTLGEALRKHGVTDADAARLEESIPPGSSVLTVTLGDDVHAGSQGPATVIERCGGRLLTADSGLTTDEQQLERGEVRQRREVAASQERDDVPKLHEEFFTERRRIPR
ncbi:MAG: hypothetical protein ABR591_13325 [Candidatus Velthaea sp.]